MKNIAYVGIGSNLENKKINCLNAIDQMKAGTHISVVSQSSFYETEPVGVDNQDWFINCVVLLKTSFSPVDLLVFLQKIEVNLKRQRPYQWAPRTIDLDILFFNRVIMESPRLTLPHPLLHQRMFVLVPLMEINPKLIHPLLKQSISDLVKLLNSTQKVIRIN